MLNKFFLIAAEVVLLCCCTIGQTQPINYISNGGFEEVITSTSTPLFYHARFWGSVDTLKIYGEPQSAVTAPIKVPKNGGNNYTYQWPRSGNNDLGSTLFCPTCPAIKRSYPRNRLHKTLKPNTIYCFSMYINLANNSSYGIDAIGAYFGDSSLDTITKCTIPLTYITPQIQNPVNNIITDTLNWVLIQGQFTANGTEKYALIGDFKSDASTNKVLASSIYSPSIFSDYIIDDVSLIELNLPAYAGRDTVIFAGDSVFLGREPDVGINDDCIWYKLPGTIPIDTVAGFWVKPTQDCSYIVRQEICGLVKWDTVKIYMDAVGIKLQDLARSDLRIYPLPAMDYFELKFDPFGGSAEKISAGLKKLFIFNSLGELIREEETNFKNGSVKVNTSDLESGAYLIRISNQDNESVSKKLLIAK